MESSFVRVSDEIGQALADGRPVVGLETTLITHGLPQTEGIDVAAESGAKAVLDLPRTLEMLESLGVPVLGFRTDRFPAFYRRDSGLSVDARAERVEDLAAAVRAHLDLARAGGVLVVNPIPAEFEMSEDLYARSLDRAVEDA